MPSRAAVLALLLVFLLPWTALTLAFDGLIVSGMVRQVLATSWPHVPGTILQSEVEAERGSKSTTYGFKVLYAYTVGGERHESTQYRHGAWRSGDSGYAQWLVERFPSGATVSVYYRPGQPSDAVLMTGVQSGDLFLLLFLLPFNLVALGMGFMLARLWRRKAALPVFSREGCECVTLGERSPALTAFVTMGVAAFVCMLLVGVAGGVNPPVSVALGAWGAVLASGVFAGRRIRARLKAGYYDLRVDPRARSVSLPPVSGRKARLDVPWSDIGSISVETHVTQGSKGRTITRYRPTLELSGLDGRGRREVIASLSSQEEAQALADWLRSHLGKGDVNPGALRSA